MSQALAKHWDVYPATGTGGTSGNRDAKYLSSQSFNDKNPHLSGEVLVTPTWMCVWRRHGLWENVRVCPRGRELKLVCSRLKGTDFLGLNPSEKKGRLLKSPSGEPQSTTCLTYALTTQAQSRGSLGVL